MYTLLWTLVDMTIRHRLLFLKIHHMLNIDKTEITYDVL